MTTTSEIITQEKGVLVVGMGEIVVSALPDAVLTCVGLGSCIAVCAYDKLAKIGGVVHVVLPNSHSLTKDNPAKFADTAIPLLVNEITKIGGVRDRLTVKIAGGAQIIIAVGIKDVFNTGEKNVTEILAALEKEKIPLAAADIGGSLGRTVKMYLNTGRITIKTVKGTVSEL
ncbi:MAG: chemotaxis protein CheD [Dehalococcoidales bacterium]